DLSLPLEKRTPAPLPPLDRAGQRFDAISWSRDGKWLAGGSGSGPGVFLYSPRSRSYTRLTEHGGVPRWLPDGRTLLVLDEGRLFSLDIGTRILREILAPPPNSTFVTHCVAPDGRSLFVSRLSEEGDIGMLTIQRADAP